MGSPLRRASERAGVEQACAATGFGLFGQCDGNAVFWQGLPVGYVIRQKSKGRGGRSLCRLDASCRGSLSRKECR